MRGAIANYSFEDIVQVGRDWETEKPTRERYAKAEQLGGVFQCNVLRYLAECRDQEKFQETEELTKYWRENISSV